MIKRIVQSIFRIFLLITGFIPFILFVKPKYFFVSAKAKQEFRKNKEGVLLISNHTGIFDYYCFIYKYAFAYVHTFVAEVVYKNKWMKFLNDTMGNIRIDRTINQNMTAFQSAIDYLRKGKKVLIFPEGKIEAKKGNIEEFTNSFAFLSLKTGKPIIPFYIDGNYGLFKRPTITVGEKIYPSKISNDIDDNLISEYSQSVRQKILELKTIDRDHKKVRTKTLFTKKYWLHDFARITSIPAFYLIFPTRKYYLGNKKSIKKALKYNAVICANHCGPCDPMFIYMHFLSRRSRIIAADEIFNVKALKTLLVQSGVIKYRRTTSVDSMDLIAFKEAIETLNGRGVIGVFPEGHINFDCSFDESLQEGAATMSLITNSPIIPFIFVDPYKYFRMNHVVIGEPIYPSDVFKSDITVNVDSINLYNSYLYSKMKEIYDFSVTKRRKKYGKNRYFKSLEESDEENVSEGRN